MTTFVLNFLENVLRQKRCPLAEKCSFPIFHHVLNTSVVDISCVWIGQMSHVTWHGVMSELRPGHGRHGPLEQGLWTVLNSGLGLDLWTVD